MHSSDHSKSPLEGAVAEWLARRDRGLTAAEQDAYLQWLREDPRHGTEIARLERAWTRLDGLQLRRPAGSALPDPDLLAPPRRIRLWPVVLAMAAAVVLGVATWRVVNVSRQETATDIVRADGQRLTLADGSRVELKPGAKVEVAFSPATRAVRLVTGEAYFIVAKDATRPFVVSANKVAVRAVGTAFSVQMQTDAVAILVTEGKVRLDRETAAGDVSATNRELGHVAAGQQAIVCTKDDAAAPVQIAEVAAVEMERAVAWQTTRLEFAAMPLRDVVAQFNRFNSCQLVVEDERTGAIVVGGNFRADNVAAFVRLLDVGFGVSAQQQDDRIVLRRR